MGEHKVIVIGSGPAGYTAALYLARAEIETLVLAGEQSGGQLMLTGEVENYPGFEEAVKGPELMLRMRKQAERFGAQVEDKQVVKVDFSQRPFRLWVSKIERPDYQAQAVIIATGAQAKMLGVGGEKEFLGRGVSTCAVCDAYFYKDKRTAVVGGGDTAMEEVLTLVKVAAEVTLIHRRDQLRASKIMQRRVLEENRDKVRVLWNTLVEEIVGEEKVRGVRLKNIQTDETDLLDLDGVFIAIGHKPTTELFQGQLELDEKGYIVPRLGFSVKSVEMAQKYLDEQGLLKFPMMTSVKGVFAAGDVVDFRYRQAVTAAGFGCMAGLDVKEWLRDN